LGDLHFGQIEIGGNGVVAFEYEGATRLGGRTEIITIFFSFNAGDLGWLVAVAASSPYLAQ